MELHFFLDPDFDPEKGALNADESRHAVKSLRLRAGDHLEVGDGKGRVYTAAVVDTAGKQLKLEVEDKRVVEKPRNTLVLAIAPPKNQARFDWFLEKSTELGVDVIVPILTDRAVRTYVKKGRAERVLLAASKQSRRPFLPEFASEEPLESIFKRATGHRYMAHCRIELNRVKLSDEPRVEVDGLVWVLIGPEGDFSEAEIQRAEEVGFRGLDLGERRLRTETAGVLAVGVIKLRQDSKE